MGRLSELFLREKERQEALGEEFAESPEVADGGETDECLGDETDEENDMENELDLTLEHEKVPIESKSVNEGDLNAVSALLQLSSGIQEKERVVNMTAPTDTTGVWEFYVKQKFVQDFVSSLPPISIEEEISMRETMTREHGYIHEKQHPKLCVMERIFKKMEITKVQDTRILEKDESRTTTLFIIEAVWMPGDGLTGDNMFFQKNGRSQCTTR